MTDWWSIVNRVDAEGEPAPAEKSTHADLLIYDVIGEDMWTEDPITAGRFVKELRALDVKTLNVRINSPGGSVFDGNAIYNALKAHPAKVTSYVDGHALSIASVIALAADEVVIAPNGVFMIHDPSAFAMGTAQDMRKAAEMLDRAKSSIVSSYRDKTGRPDSEISSAMSDETWFDAKEAVDWGLADRIAKEPTPVALATLTDDLRALSVRSPKAFASFQHVPVAMLGETRPVAPAEHTANNEEDTMDVKAMALLLGLPENATEEQVTAEVERLKAVTEEPTPTPEELAAIEAAKAKEEEDEDDEQKLSKDDSVRLDPAAYAALVAKADRGDAVATKIETQERDTFLQNAISDGKFPKARLDHYLKAWAADATGTRELIDSLEKGLVPVTGQTSTTTATDAFGEGNEAYPSHWLPELAN